MTVGEAGAAREIAYRITAPGIPDRPSVFWLAGFKSDMASTKATALRAFAAGNGLGSTAFDYSGHGISGGSFEDGTIGRWLEEAAAIFRLSHGSQIVVGSSMGGHIALLLLRHLMQDAPEEAQRIRGLVLIAPAWDMTEELMWKKFPASIRQTLLETGSYAEPSAYGEPYLITRALIEDGRKHLLARKPFDPGRPIIILQGLLDADVPASHTRELASFLTGGWTKLVEIPDGEHRLSRPQDLAKLFDAVASLKNSHPGI